MAAFWEKDQIVAQGGPRPVFVAPDPIGEAENARQDRELQLRERADARAQAEADRKSEEAALKEQQRAGALQDSIAQMRTVIDAARQAKELSRRGWFATGFGAETAKGVGGTTATDVASLLNTIGSNTAFDRLTKMREESPTGGALGSVSEIELQLLRDSIASLNQSQSDEQFQQSMDRVIEAYTRVLNRIAPNETPGARRPEMVGDVPRGSEIQFGMDRFGEAGFNRDAALMELFGVTPNQEATVTAFWNANRGNQSLTPEAVKRYYAEIGVPVPSDELIALGIEQAKQGAMFGGFDTSAAERVWDQRIEAEAARRGEMGAIDLAGQGLMAGLGDESAGIGGAIAAMLKGMDPGEAYRFENELRDFMLEKARQKAGGVGTTAELLGNAASLGIATNIPSSVGMAVREGAVAGAVPGFGYGEGAQESMAGAATGAVAGAALGKLLAGRGGPKAPGPGANVVQAADDLNARTGSNIIPLPADVGGTTVRRATGGIAQSTFGAKPIVDAAQRVTTETGKAVRAIAAEVGTPQEIEAAGQKALAGAQKWMKSTRTKVDALYTKARNLSEGVKVPLTNARRVLDEHIAELEQTPGGAEGLERLRALREEIGEDYTVDGIKRMRSTLRDRFMGDGLRRSDLERRVSQIVDAAEQDVADGLNAAGRQEAAAAWTKAAAEHRRRAQVIDNVLAPVIGKRSDAPRSGEQIMRAIGNLSKSDNAKLAKFINALPSEEAGTVRATIISRLGTRDAEGGNFSLNTFLTQWDGMSDAAKRTLFGGELTEALNKVATVSRGSTQAQRFANFSNTGSSNWAMANMGGAAAGILPGVVMVAGQYGLGRLLASPAFARWLARLPKSPQAMPKHIEGLSRIAASEAGVAQNALGLQRALSESFGAGQLPLAAQPVPLEPVAQDRPSGSPETAGAPR